MKLSEIAARITAHLKRFEADPAINQRSESNRILPYWHSGAGATGRYVSISYVTFLGSSKLSKPDAITYLAWLDAGNVGHHWSCLRRK